MEIYIAEGTQQTGPFDLDTIKTGLRTGKYTPSQLAWYEGAPGWEPISKLPGLEAVAAPPPPPPPVAPPLPTPYSSAPPMPTGSYSPPPPSFVPPPTYPSYGPGTSNAPAKRGFWAKVGTVLLGLLAILGGILKISRPFTHSYSSSSYQSSSTPSYSNSYAGTPTPTPTTRTSGRVMPYFNSANQFTSGERQKYYVNFFFSYPTSWEMVSGTKTEHAEDFVEMNRPYQGIYVESFQVEDFYTNGTSLAADLPTLGAKYMASVDANNRKKTPSHRRISEGVTTLRTYTAYDYRAQSVGKNAAGKPYDVYVRYLIVAPPTGQNGVILEMTASSSSPENKGVNDLGTKGEMAKILDSFTFL